MKITHYIIIILTIIICVQYCRNTNTNTNTPIKPDTTIEEKQIINYKDSIIYRDSIIFTYVSIKDSISKSNKNTLDKHYDKQMDSLNANRRDYRDTLIEGLVYEIEISDTIISDLNKTIEFRDTVIHNLEIMNATNKLYIEDIEKEIIKSEKKIKRRNVWAIVSTSVAAILTIILIAS